MRRLRDIRALEITFAIGATDPPSPEQVYLIEGGMKGVRRVGGCVGAEFQLWEKTIRQGREGNKYTR